MALLSLTLVAPYSRNRINKFREAYNRPRPHESGYTKTAFLYLCQHEFGVAVCPVWIYPSTRIRYCDLHLLSRRAQTKTAKLIGGIFECSSHSRNLRSGSVFVSLWKLHSGRQGETKREREHVRENWAWSQVIIRHLQISHNAPCLPFPRPRSPPLQKKKSLHKHCF